MIYIYILLYILYFIYYILYHIISYYIISYYIILYYIILYINVHQVVSKNPGDFPLRGCHVARHMTAQVKSILCRRYELEVQEDEDGLGPGGLGYGGNALVDDG